MTMKGTLSVFASFSCDPDGTGKPPLTMQCARCPFPPPKNNTHTNRPPLSSSFPLPQPANTTTSGGMRHAASKVSHGRRSPPPFSTTLPHRPPSINRPRHASSNFKFATCPAGSARSRSTAAPGSWPRRPCSSPPPGIMCWLCVFRGREGGVSPHWSCESTVLCSGLASPLWYAICVHQREDVAYQGSNTHTRSWFDLSLSSHLPGWARRGSA